MARPGRSAAVARCPDWAPSRRRRGSAGAEPGSAGKEADAQRSGVTDDGTVAAVGAGVEEGSSETEGGLHAEADSGMLVSWEGLGWS